MSTMTSTRHHTEIASPIGVLTAVAEGSALVGLYFEGHLRRPPAETFGERDDHGFDDLRVQLEEYVAGRRRGFELELAPVGDAFQQRVWALLCEIPYGETRSYGDLARLLGDARLAQMVGRANALNPISIVVPCHRVVGADGSLTGYAGGLARKRWLLDLETPAADLAGRLF